MSYASQQKAGAPLAAYAAVVVVFLLLPIVIATAVAFNPGERPAFPPTGLSFRWFAAVLHSSVLMDGLRSGFIQTEQGATRMANGLRKIGIDAKLMGELWPTMVDRM
jgi:hypothetical protein